MAILDTVRSEREGREEEIRSARLRLLELLLRYQSNRRALDLQERRVLAQEAVAAAASVDPLDGLLSALAGTPHPVTTGCPGAPAELDGSEVAR